MFWKYFMLTTTVTIGCYGAQKVQHPIDVQSITGDIDFNDCRTDIIILPDDGNLEFMALSYSFSKEIAIVRINNKIYKLKQLQFSLNPYYKSKEKQPQIIWANAIVRIEIFLSLLPNTQKGQAADSEYSELNEFAGTMLVRIGDSVRSYKVKGESGC